MAVNKRKYQNNKQKLEEEEKTETSEALPPPTRFSDDPPLKKPKWINRQRVLVFCNSLISARDRYFMKDLMTVMPHSREDFKLKTVNAVNINEMCTARNCNKALFIEARKCLGLYLWVSCPPDGPSVYFSVQNIVTMFELNLPGNCLRGSRPLLSFDEQFDKQPHLKLIKEIFVQVFGVPHNLPKSQPFTDRVITFTFLDQRIWYRQYQILKEDGALAEIGPRFILFPIKVFSGSFGGDLLWKNQKYVNPKTLRAQIKKSRENDYLAGVRKSIARQLNAPTDFYPEIPNHDIFEGDTLTRASNISNQNIPSKLNDPEVRRKALIDFRSAKEIELAKAREARKQVPADYAWTVTTDSSVTNVNAEDKDPALDEESTTDESSIDDTDMDEESV